MSSPVNSEIVICSSGAREAASCALVSPSFDASSLNHDLTFLNSISGQPKYSANLLVVVSLLVSQSLLLSMRPKLARSLT